MWCSYARFRALVRAVAVLRFDGTAVFDVTWRQRHFACRGINFDAIARQLALWLPLVVCRVFRDLDVLRFARFVGVVHRQGRRLVVRRDDYASLVRRVGGNGRRR